MSIVIGLISFEDLRGAAMFRFSLLLCLSVLLYGSSASPFKSWGKKADTALQETSLSDEYDEKMKVGLKEVEPLEDLDLTKADVELSMLLWKAVRQLGQQRYDKPEEDKDDLYHPYEAKLTVDNELPDAFIQPQARLHQQPEEDMDELYHGLFDLSELEKPDGEMIQDEEPAETGAKEAGSSERLMYMSQEEDKDDLYHGHIPSGIILEDQVMQAFDNILKRVYSEPEEDLDKLYHK